MTATVSLGTLLADIDESWAGFRQHVTRLDLDSRNVTTGSLFMAYRGEHIDRGRFVDAAIAAGAAAVLVEPHFTAKRQYPVPVLKVSALRTRLGEIASRFHDNPSTKQRVIGVTGTNGKSTVVWQLSQALSLGQRPTAMIGTLGCGPPGKQRDSTCTTPDAITLQTLLASFCRQVENTVLEVSSHALIQGRVAGTTFNTAVFTQISREHLDYHKSMAAYAAAKFRLFESPGLRHAVLNLDDKRGRRWLVALQQNGLDIYGFTRTKAIWHAYQKHCPIVYGKHTAGPEEDILSLSTPWGDGILCRGQLAGFDVENLLASVTVLGMLGLPIDDAIALLEAVPAPPGRMESFGGGTLPHLVVDYAHTPDALRQALQVLRRRAKGSLTCVFGCGGERDTGKRSLMGTVAGQLADRVILTDDNPRGEPSRQIIADILSGLHHPEQAQIITPRAAAIRAAFAQATAGDIILLAGKGHETRQQFRNHDVPCSDRALAAVLCAEQTKP